MLEIPIFDAMHTKHHKLDLSDKKILYYLLKNSRISFTEIAKKVHLSKESVQYRYHKFLEKGIVLRSYATINYEKLGYQKYHILLVVDDEKKNLVKKFVSTLDTHPSVLRVIRYNDHWDFEIVVLAQNVLDFDALVYSILGQFEDIILKKDTEVVIEVQENNAFPEVRQLKLGGKVSNKNSTKKKLGEVKLDHLDLSILEILSGNARLSSYKISEKIPLSHDAISRRIKKMLASGIIKGFTCLLNYSDLDYQGYVFCFNSSNMKQSDEKKFISYYKQSPYVFSIKKMVGAWDIRNYVVVKHINDLHSLVLDFKSKFSSVVQNYQTWVTYKEYVFNPFPKVLLEE